MSHSTTIDASELSLSLTIDIAPELSIPMHKVIHGLDVPFIAYLAYMNQFYVALSLCGLESESIFDESSVG